MQTFGAELTGNQRTLPRTTLLQQLRKHRGWAAFRVEEERRQRVVGELRKARLTGIRVKLLFSGRFAPTILAGRVRRVDGRDVPVQDGPQGP